MLEHHILEGNDTVLMICQMYDYVHFGFVMGSPYQMNFYVNLKEQDIDLIIAKLQQAKRELRASKKLIEGNVKT